VTLPSREEEPEVEAEESEEAAEGEAPEGEAETSEPAAQDGGEAAPEE
jgi:hypothetical protein